MCGWQSLPRRKLHACTRGGSWGYGYGYTSSYVWSTYCCCCCYYYKAMVWLRRTTRNTGNERTRDSSSSNNNNNNQTPTARNVTCPASYILLPPLPPPLQPASPAKKNASDHTRIRTRAKRYIIHISRLHYRNPRTATRNQPLFKGSPQYALALQTHMSVSIESNCTNYMYRGRGWKGEEKKRNLLKPIRPAHDQSPGFF